jgi:hypothetical protein
MSENTTREREERLEEALLDIMQTASNSHTQSRRSRWIYLRAESAIEGNESYREALLPRDVDSELKRANDRIRRLVAMNRDLAEELARNGIQIEIEVS